MQHLIYHFSFQVEQSKVGKEYGINNREGAKNSGGKRQAHYQSVDYR